MSRASCDTKTKPPLKFAMAVVSASTDSISKWFVGSSSTRMWGLLIIKAAKATRAFWPPDKLPILVKCAEPGRPNCPSTARAFSGGDKSNAEAKYSTPVLSKGSNSSKCW
mmetsp:Transcript_28895/g.83747  ORF Transcript_28895/g.83747 Transcript_28895/m.83747 type:complete len:110 (+) Transcript_28895:2553-2882(+)